MRKITFASLAVIALGAPAFAQGSDSTMIDMDTMLGTTMEDVTTTLTEMGYEVRKSEMEDGKMGEVYVSPETGKPTKIKME